MEFQINWFLSVIVKVCYVTCSISLTFSSLTLYSLSQTLGSCCLNKLSVFMCARSCPSLCDPRDCSPPCSLFMGFSSQEYCHFLLQGIFLAQWSTQFSCLSFIRRCIILLPTPPEKNPDACPSLRKWKSLSHVLLSATPWTIQFMEFPRPEYWSG